MPLKRRVRVEGNESPRQSESKSFLALQESVVLTELGRVAFFSASPTGVRSLAETWVMLLALYLDMLSVCCSFLGFMIL